MDEQRNQVTAGIKSPLSTSASSDFTALYKLFYLLTYLLVWAYNQNETSEITTNNDAWKDSRETTMEEVDGYDRRGL